LQIGVHGVEERTQKAQNEASTRTKKCFCAFLWSSLCLLWFVPDHRVALGYSTVSRSRRY